MTQYGFYFDATRCTGCKTCEAACRDYHNLDLGTTFRHVYELEGGGWNQAEDGTWTTDSFTYYTSFACQHCDDPACMHVCPTGAIRPITTADKSATQVGHAVWVAENCVVLTDGVKCGNCARHCPAGAIQMVKYKQGRQSGKLRIPAVNTERCIGCGACENLCPARPFSAIYVEGHSAHRTI